MKNVAASFAEKRRILQLETLYDLAVVLHANRPEQELVDDLLQRVCSVLDPAAAVAVTRDALLDRLAEAGIDARPAWRPLHTQPCYQGAFVLASTKVAERLHREGVCLPSSSHLSEADQQRVVDSTREAVAAS